MKRFLLILLFIISQFLLPFVFAKCGGEDTPYARSNTQAQPDAHCKTDPFLTADCIKPAPKTQIKASEISSDDSIVDDENGDDEVPLDEQDESNQ